MQHGGERGTSTSLKDHKVFKARQEKQTGKKQLVVVVVVVPAASWLLIGQFSKLQQPNFLLPTTKPPSGSAPAAIGRLQSPDVVLAL